MESGEIGCSGGGEIWGNGQERIDGRLGRGAASSVGQRLPSPTLSRSKPSPARSAKKPPPDSPNLDDPSLDNPDLGPFLLKLARDTIAFGDGPLKALDYATRAAKSFERCAVEGEPSLDLVMSLHVLAAIYCSLGRFEEAVPVLERAIKVPEISRGPDHALAAFSSHMQLGDTYSMLGQVEKSIGCYEEGLKIQIQALGETDARVGETCSLRSSSGWACGLKTRKRDDEFRMVILAQNR